MKVEVDPLQTILGFVQRHRSVVQDSPLVWYGGLLITGLILLVLTVAVLLFSLSFIRYVKLNILGTDMYAHMPRPRHRDNKFLFQGDLGLIDKLPPAQAHNEYTNEVKSQVYVYRGLFYTPRVYLADPKAMTHIFSAANSYNYPKPLTSRILLASFLGEGIIVAEGDVHKRQRKILQPAFSVSAIRELNPIFMKYSEALAMKIGEMVDRSAEAGSDKKGAVQPDGVHSAFRAQSVYSLKMSRPGAPVLDVNWWVTKAALDIIGDAGFAYHFHALKASVDPNMPPSEEEKAGAVLGNTFNALFKATSQVTIARFLQLFISSFWGMSWFGRFPTQRQRLIDSAYKELETISLRIVKGKKREIQEEIRAEVEARGGDEKNNRRLTTKADFDEKDSFKRPDRMGPSAGKDLLHLMMRANMAADVHPREKLEDSELIGQITTLLLAGHETTSNQTAWTLWLLACNPEMQQKLRDEVHEHFGREMDREVGHDELMEMEYLDAVCKETMRCRTAVPTTSRVSADDDEVPLSRAYPTRDGRSTFSSVKVKKGQELLIPIQGFNSSTDVWGPDADEFRPDRWLDLPPNAKNNGLPWHLMTFIAGPRGCIGNRFALAELKAMLCHLLGRFHFDPVPDWKVEGKQSVVVRPRIVGQEELGPQMPLRISRI